MFKVEGATREQQRVIFHTDGPAEVFAGPGSGKTFTLTCRTARLINDGIVPDRILLLTFTNKAAGEMRQRILDYVGDIGYDVVSGTFHGFCVRILIRYGKTINFPRINILSSGECVSMIRRLRDTIDKGGKCTPSPKQCLGIFSRSSNTGVPMGTLISGDIKIKGCDAKAVSSLYKAYQDEKRLEGVLDFDDILIYTAFMLENVAWVRDILVDEYRHIMIDEYQDTNMLQARIVKVLASRHRNIMVVGDVNQSIFGFRGADYKNILFFQGEYPDAKRFTLTKNFRSVAEIVEVANNVIVATCKGEKTLLQAHRDGEGTVFIEEFPNPMGEGEWISTYILELLQQGISPSDIAVLYRNNFHATVVEGFLKGVGIPYSRSRGNSFADGEHIQDIIAFLRVLFGNKTAWIRVFSLIDGVGAKTAEKLYQQYVVEKAAPGTNKYVKEALDIIKWAQSVTMPETSEQVYTLCQDAMRQYAKYFRQKWTEEKEILRRKKDMLYILSFASKVTTLDDFLCFFLMDDEVEEEDGEHEQAPNVSLTTIHGAKGKEWRIVFLIQCSDGNFPSWNAEDLEEEWRLFYVAITRPKDALIITHTTKGIGKSDKIQRASQFLSRLGEK